MDLIDDDGVISSTWIVQYFRRLRLEMMRTMDQQSNECTLGPEQEDE